MPKPIKLSTPVSIPSHEEKFSCESKILTLGSCFSDHIGNRLSNHMFDVLVNPFGTIFNPVSIAKVLSMAIKNDLVSADELNLNGNRYFHYDFHSSFDSTSPQQTEEMINKAVERVKEFIGKTDFLILTFGTSIVYKLKSTDTIVSNCHKVPNYNFEKEFLTGEFMEKNTLEILDSIKKINPSVKVILTVSPVRHTKEGLIENSLSKSRLIDLCYRLTANNSDFSYFPSYEIMMDELRDYRYYKSDLIHPNDLAIDIIWKYFRDTYFDTKSEQKIKDIDQLQQAHNHIPFDPLSPEHKKFRQKQMEIIGTLKIQYPEVDFSEFEAFFEE